MSSRGEALLGRFRAGSLDRIRGVTLTLIEMQDRRGTAEQMKDVARELHTLKGESRMLNLPEISEVAHAAEDRLLGSPGGDGLPHPGVCAQVIAALEVVARSLRGELGDETSSSAALLLAKEQLSAVDPHPTPLPQAEEGDDHINAADQAEPGPAPGRWVQVNAVRVDEICEEVGAFTSDFRGLFARFRSALREDPALAVRMRGLLEGFERTESRLEDISSAAWALRLVPVEPMLADLVKHARELALSQGKRVRVLVRGGDAQLERSVIDHLWDPMVHLVRNSIDHGIEGPGERDGKPQEGCLTLGAEAVGSSIVITVADDGRGIHADRVREAAVGRGLLTRETALTLSHEATLELLFTHGFSTRAQVSALSGRGVGLDVVRSAIEEMGGSVSIHSEVGLGTCFALTVPATISKERSVVFLCGGILFAIPSRHIVEVIRMADHPVEPVAGGKALRYRDERVPLRSMSRALLRTEGALEPWGLILGSGGRHVAFSVPELHGECDLVRQPVDLLLSRSGYVAASATIDDGRLVLLITVAGLLRRSEGGLLSPVPAEKPRKRRQVLVVDDSPIIRDLVSQVLLGGGLEVHEAPEARSALHFLESNRPDAVLLDVDMPGMNGFELLEQIRLRTRSLPVIMFTTRFSPDDQQRASRLGADAYIIKSQFQEAALLETVRRFACVEA